MANTFVPADYPLEERTVGRALARSVACFGDKPFVETVGNEQVTYREMDRRSNRFAHGAAEFGIKHQEPILVMLPDVVDYLVVWCGLGKRGAVEVPVNLAYRKGIPYHICNDSTARTMIIDRSLRGEDSRRGQSGMPSRSDGRNLHPPEEPMACSAWLLEAPRVHRPGFRDLWYNTGDAGYRDEDGRF